MLERSQYYFYSTLHRLLNPPDGSMRQVLTLFLRTYFLRDSAPLFELWARCREEARRRKSPPAIEVAGKWATPIAFFGGSTVHLSCACSDVNDLHNLFGEAGQVLSVSITSKDGAAVFLIAAPAGRLDDGRQNFESISEPGVREWSGELPVTGFYLISVVLPRRDSEYGLDVSLRSRELKAA